MSLRNYKIKSSAILIVLVLGVIISGMIVGVTILMAQQTKISNQASDGKVAYRAAMSGIEDGLLRYKYARAQNKLNLLTNTIYDFPINPVQTGDSSNLDSSYQLSFSSGYIGLEADGKDAKYDAKIDEMIDIDLSSFLRLFKGCATTTDPAKLKCPTEIVIKKTENKFHADQAPKVFSFTNQTSGFYAPINITIDDSSKKGEAQVVLDYTNDEPTNNKIIINLEDASGAKKCWAGEAAETQCHLKIKPMIAKRSPGILNADKGNRISGGQSGSGACSATAPQNCKNKYIKLSVASNGIVDGLDTLEPSMIIIKSIGKAGGKAYRTLEARIDGSSGNYLGIFDYGVYCGDNCVLGKQP